MPNSEKKLSLIVELINKTEAQFRQISNDLESMNNSTKNTSDILGKVGTVAGVAFGGLSLGINQAVNDYAQFSAEIRRVGAFVNASAEQLQDFEDVAVSAAEGTKFSALDAAKALGSLAGGEVSAKEAAESLSDVIDVALVAGMTDLNMATNVAYAAMTQFADEGLTVANVADTLAVVASKVTVETQAWSMALSDTSTAARLSGLSFGDLNTLMAGMVSSGIRVSMVGGAIESALKRMNISSDAAKESLKGSGQSVNGLRQAIANGPLDMIKYLSDGMANAANEGEYLNNVVGQRGANEFGALIRKYREAPEALEDLAASFANTAGAADGLIQVGRSSETAVQNLGEAFGNLRRNIGEAMGPLVSSVINPISAVVQKLADFAKEFPGLTAAVLGLTWTLTGLVSVIIATAFAMKGLTTAMIIMKPVKTVAIALYTLMGTKVTWLGIQTGIMTAYTNAWMVKQALLNGVLKVTLLLMSPVGLIIAAVAALVIYLGVQIYKLSKDVGGFGNAFKLVWQAIKIQVVDTIIILIEWFGKMVDLIPGIDNSFKTTVDNLKAGADQMELDLQATADAMAATKASTDETSMSIEEMIAGVKENMPGMVDVAEETAEGTDEAFKRMVEGAKEIRDEIVATYKEMQQANEDFLKSTATAESDYRGDVVSTVAEAKNRIEELEKEIKEAKKDDNAADRVKKLKEELEEQKDIVATYKTLELDIDKEIAEERKRLAMNELERITFDHNKKLMLMQIEYLEDQLKRAQKLEALKVEEQFFIDSVGVQKAAAINAELEKTVAFRTNLQNQKSGLTSWMAETQAMYSSYVANVNATMSQLRTSSTTTISSSKKSGSRAIGGNVQPGRTFLVGERGPELFSPGEYGRIHSNGTGSGVTVVFTNNHFTDDKYAEQITNKIVKDFTRVVKFSN